jgi:hypothetical protein
MAFLQLALTQGFKMQDILAEPNNHKFGRYCDRALYEKLMNEFYEKKKKSREHINILDELSTETDWYEMNEYEMSLLTGVSITTLRNNRRSSITTPRWPYRKGDGRANGALVTYVLGEVKTKLASS